MDSEDPSEGEESDGQSQPLAFFANPRRIIETLVAVTLLVVAIYVLLPKIVGFEDAVGRLGEGKPLWIVAALGFNVLAFFSYVALFRGVIGETAMHLEWRESYQITMAGLAATRLFSAGGAGGIVLTYWALRKAGMPRRESAARMVAFLVLLYAVYMASLIVFGILLRTGVLSGQDPVGLTIVPAAVAGGLVLIAALFMAVPEDVERRLSSIARGDRFVARWARRLASVPATISTGTRTAFDFIRNRERGGAALIGALGFWASNIAVLWAAFHAFGVEVPLGVVVQGFFVGMVANLIPFAPGGVGSVDAGLIAAFVLFGLPSAEVFPAVLLYRLIAFWLPLPPGIVAYFQLRRTVRRWEEEFATGERHTLPAAAS